MNKTKTFIVAAMLTVASLVQAKDYHVVIKEKDKSIGRTEVFVGGNFQSDTITVNPVENITEIQFSIKTLDGEVLQSETIPFNVTEDFNFITPHMPEEYQVKKGEREVTINTSNYAKGNYIITLLNDGKKLDSRQIICK